MAVARDYSIFDLYDFINNDQAAVNFLQVRNLIRNNDDCPRCNQILVLSQFNSNVNVGYVLRCPNRNCRARKSLIIQLKFLLFNVLLGQVLLFTAINGQLIMAF